MDDGRSRVECSRVGRSRGGRSGGGRSRVGRSRGGRSGGGRSRVGRSRVGRSRVGRFRVGHSSVSRVSIERSGSASACILYFTFRGNAENTATVTCTSCYVVVSSPRTGVREALGVVLARLTSGI